ncbi:MAG TPA: DUF192 domain-containing protein [Castellaniella sp.]|uniref:DUF192 domain-containing protein n=1 Tax=Castellaniella sp. TaxID=1955812 RepID=UPI002F00D0F5
MSLQICCAVTFWQRLLGVRALPDRDAPDWGLLLPRCWAVHTVGLAHPLDVLFVTAAGEVLRVARALPPNRWVAHFGAWGVLELPAGYCSVPGWSERVSAAWGDWKIDV